MLKTKNLYLALSVVGTVFPYGALIPWLIKNGPDPNLLVGEITASKISTFAWLDVGVSAIALTVFMTAEGKRLNVKNLWIPFLAVFTVGVSLALPMFLWMRENALEKIR